MADGTIHDWFLNEFRGLDRPVRILEVGVHHGTDTTRLASLAPHGIDWIGLEPDPRNADVCRRRGLHIIEAAASDVPGVAVLHLSDGETPGCPGRVHTDSSSLRTPTAHLDAHPWCTFTQTVEVSTTRVDDVAPEGWAPDLLWVDVQGAQAQVLRGARRVLDDARYLFIECHPTPMYDGEPTFEALCALLEGWRVKTCWPADILFERIA